MMKYGLFAWTGFDGSYGASYVNLIMDIGALDWAKICLKGKCAGECKDNAHVCPLHLSFSSCMSAQVSDEPIRYDKREDQEDEDRANKCVPTVSSTNLGFGSWFFGVDFSGRC